MAYKQEFAPKENDCDQNRQLKISAAMRHMQQIAGEQVQSLGLSYEKLLAENMVFLLTKSCIKIDRMPTAGERIIASTAPIQTRGVRYNRDFIFEDIAGNRLLSAFTLWVLVDPGSRGILRPSAFPYRLPFEDSLVAGAIGDVEIPSSEEIPTVRSLEIRASMIDENGHVNNSHYADFVCDALPRPKLLDRGIDTLVISFLGEAKFGHALSLSTFTCGSGQYLIKGNKEDGRRCFEALALFK